ncbi:MAG: hypothetical protein HY457_01430 [Parcubacteria group bacterium]|nr:hypothetical protein [Parcubacteria group bacterium]
MQTINLLPPTHKRTLYRWYRGRLILVAMALFIALFTGGTLFAFPALFLGEVNVRAAEERLALAHQATERAEKTFVTEQSRAAMRKAKLLRAEEGVALTHTEVLKEVISKKSRDIIIGELFYREEAKKPSGIVQTLIVRGESKNRSVLLAFSEALQSLPFVENVELPVEQLAKSSEIPFSITLTYRSAQDQGPEE